MSTGVVAEEERRVEGGGGVSLSCVIVWYGAREIDEEGEDGLKLCGRRGHGWRLVIEWG